MANTIFTLGPRTLREPTPAAPATLSLQKMRKPTVFPPGDAAAKGRQVQKKNKQKTSGVNSLPGVVIAAVAVQVALAVGHIPCRLGAPGVPIPSDPADVASRPTKVLHLTQAAAAAAAAAVVQSENGPNSSAVHECGRRIQSQRRCRQVKTCGHIAVRRAAARVHGTAARGEYRAANLFAAYMGAPGSWRLVTVDLLEGGVAGDALFWSGNIIYMAVQPEKQRHWSEGSHSGEVFWGQSVRAGARWGATGAWD